MSIKDKLDRDLKLAMKDRDSRRTACIRMLKARLLDREVALRAKCGTDHVISDEDARSVIATYAKQRRDSIESYRQGGRDDLVADEEAELEIVNGYLPEQLSVDQLRALVQAAITESGATTVKELGVVMKIVVPKVKGAADGKEVSRLVRELLSDRQAAQT